MDSWFQGLSPPFLPHPCCPDDPILQGSCEARHDAARLVQALSLGDSQEPLSYTKAGVLPVRWAWVRAIQTGGQEPSRKAWKDLPGGPVVKTSPFNVGVVGLIPDQGARIPHDFWPKRKNRSSTVTNSKKI